MGLAVFLGMAVGASEGSLAQAKPVFLLLDLIGIGTLIGLVARAPRYAQLPDMPQVQCSKQRRILYAKLSRTGTVRGKEE